MTFAIMEHQSVPRFIEATADSLRKELETNISYHQRWGGRDFANAQAKVWLALLCSFVATLIASVHIGIEKFPRWVLILLAAVSAVPGFIILTEKTFNHSGRAAWHTLYTLKLRTLHRRLRDEGAKPQEISRELGRLDEEMSGKFPQILFDTIPQPAK